MVRPIPLSTMQRRAVTPDRVASSLLDRLIDKDPDLERDPAVISAETPEGLRAALRRDLEILLNTRCRSVTPSPDHVELSDSLVSLGVEDFFATSLVTDEQRKRFAADLQSRIARFDPRLEDLSVSLIQDPVPARRSLRLKIQARYRARPGLPPIIFETRIDPVAGHYSITER
ncbi:MAG: type VI secretion system baseplate subunit TssE [Pseudorhodobacter sp.]